MGAALVAAWAVLGAGGCLLLLHRTIAVVRHCPQLRALRPDPAAWPSLSVVVPACNEAGSIAPALASLLGQDYPALQVVLVDDRSSDGTGEIMDRLAARDPRVVVDHVRELPAGWLGKVHALERGVAHATGTWMLLTDADVRLAPGTLRRAIAWAGEQGYDHLAVFPHAVLRSFWVGVCIVSAARGALALGKPWRRWTRAPSSCRPAPCAC